MKKLLLFLIAFSLSCCAFTQVDDSIKGCYHGDSLYENAQYGNETSAFQEYISNNIFPILTECRDSTDLSYKLSYIYLEITEYGKVASVQLAKFEYPEPCKKSVIEAFLNMNEWIPAKCNGAPIKSKRLIKIEF